MPSPDVHLATATKSESQKNARARGSHIVILHVTKHNT
jgi:hypothetical protein